jgi:hypothetical protein
MSGVILGSVERAGGDHLAGWCWCATRTHEPCMIEVRIDGAIWREALADRRFAGARKHGPPHDYFGFLLPLPQEVAGHRIEVADKLSGVVFGRLITEQPDPAVALLEQRIETVRAEAASMAAELRNYGD